MTIGEKKDTLIFITGGRRSGKSAYALDLGETLGEERLFIATGEPIDDEMTERIERHQRERGDRWDTIEEPVRVSEAIEGAASYDVILLDCMTLWLSQIAYKNGEAVSEAEVLKEITTLADTCTAAPATVIAVSNELGMGIIPDNPVARKFSDLSGHMNRIMAAHADEAVLVVSGIPVKIK
jgi:adenosylcobinamide kinase/adenosylcobinamide-phosphate guanylyltransferase